MPKHDVQTCYCDTCQEWRDERVTITVSDSFWNDAYPWAWREDHPQEAAAIVSESCSRGYRLTMPVATAMTILEIAEHRADALRGGDGGGDALDNARDARIMYAAERNLQKQLAHLKGGE